MNKILSNLQKHQQLIQQSSDLTSAITNKYVQFNRNRIMLSYRQLIQIAWTINAQVLRVYE